MGIEAFQAFVNHPAPAFHCEIAAARNSDRRFVARVKHHLNEPTPVADLNHFGEMLVGSSDDALRFYAQHNGCILFQDTLSEAFGLELLTVKRMSKELRSFHRYYAEALSMICDDQAEEMPSTDVIQYKSAVPIGKLPNNTTDWLVIPARGQLRGSVFLFSYEEWRTQPLASSFDGFLSMVVTDPVQMLLQALGSTARYSDGRTAIAWRPIDYLANADV